MSKKGPSAARSWWRRWFGLGGSPGDLVALMTCAGVAVVGATATALIALWRNVSGEQILDVRVDPGDGLTVDAPSGFEVVEVLGRLEASDGAYAIWSIGQALQMGAVVALAAVVLLVVDDARRGEPFARRNARRFLIAAGACLIGQIGSFVASMGELQSKHGVELTPSSSISLLWIPASLVFYALASVFHRGDALRTDAELTV